MKRMCTQTLPIEFPKNFYTNSGDYTIHIPRLGDMITSIRICGNFGNNTLGEAIINQVDFISNSTVLESLKGEFIKLDNEMNMPLEKLATSNSLVNGSFVTIQIPFYIIKKGFFMVNEPDVRISFNSNGSPVLIKGHLLVDYVLIEDPPGDTFFQRVRDVQDVYTVSTGSCTDVKMNTTFTGPVYQLYFTVQNLNTGTYIQNIKNIAMYVGSTFERFNLPGSYLRYAEPLKRYKGIPSDPIYLYTFAVDPSDIHSASGQMNFSRINSQRFEISLYPIVDPIKITIWAQTHNFVYFNKSNCAPVFYNNEYIADSSVTTISALPTLPVYLNQNYINSSYYLNFLSPLPITSNVNLSNTYITDDISAQNVLFSSPGYSNIACNYYTARVFPINIQFPGSNVASVAVDPQTNNIVMLLSNACVYHQRFGYIPIATNSIAWDLKFDVNANMIISYTDQTPYGYVVSLPRSPPFGTPTILAQKLISNYNIALFTDIANVYCSYFNATTESYNFLNITSGVSLSVFSNNISSSLRAFQFCNSSNYVSFLDPVLSNTFVFNFSSNTVTSNVLYYDGSFSTSANSSSIYINGVPIVPSVAPYYFNFNLPNYTWATDSFENIWVYNGINGVYKISVTQTLLNNLNNLQLYYYCGSKTSGSIYYTDYIHFSPNNSVTLTKIYENPVSHYLIMCGYTSSVSTTVTDTNQVNFTVPPNTNFIFTCDSTGKVSSTWKTSANDLVKYTNLINTYYNSNVFTPALPLTRFPPIQLSNVYGPSNTSSAYVVSNKVFGNATYTLGASSNIQSLTNAFKGFNGPPAWISTGGVTSYITIEMSGTTNFVSNVYISDNNIGGQYTIQASNTYSYTTLASSVPLVNNLISFKTVCYSNWKITVNILDPVNTVWSVYDVALISGTPQNSLQYGTAPITSVTGVGSQGIIVINWTYTLYNFTDPLLVYYTLSTTPNWILAVTTTCGAQTATITGLPFGTYNVAVAVPATSTLASYNIPFNIFTSGVYLTPATVTLGTLTSSQGSIVVPWTYASYVSTDILQIWYYTTAWFLAVTTTCGSSPVTISVPQFTGTYRVALVVPYGGLNGTFNINKTIYSTIQVPEVIISSLVPTDLTINCYWVYTAYSSSEPLNFYYSLDGGSSWNPGTTTTCGATQPMTISGLSTLGTYLVSGVIPGGGSIGPYNTSNTFYASTTSPSELITSLSTTSSNVTLSWNSNVYSSTEPLYVYYSNNAGTSWGFGGYTTCGSSPTTITNISGTLTSSSILVSLVVPGGGINGPFNTSNSISTQGTLAAVFISSAALTSNSINISWNYTGYSSTDPLTIYTGSTLYATTTLSTASSNIQNLALGSSYNVALTVPSGTTQGPYNSTQGFYITYQLPYIKPSYFGSPNGSLAINWTYYGYVSGDTVKIYHSSSSSGPWVLGATTTCGANTSTFGVTGYSLKQVVYMALVISSTSTTYGTYNLNLTKTSTCKYGFLYDVNITSTYSFIFSTLGTKGAIGPLSSSLYSSYNDPNYGGIQLLPGVTTPYVLTLNYGMQYYTVPCDCTLLVTMVGAGPGTQLTFTGHFSQGQVLAVAVGQAGSQLLYCGTSGSGGTFIANVTAINTLSNVLTNPTFLAAAGGVGGPGSGFNTNTNPGGVPVSNGLDGLPGAPYNAGSGGTGGSGGSVPTNGFRAADSGAGYSGNGGTIPTAPQAFINGAFGGYYTATNDPYFSSVIFLMQADYGVTDLSTLGASLTNQNVSVSTTQSIFNGTSFYFNGNSSVYTPTNSSYDIGAQTFTLEMWVRIESGTFALAGNGNMGTVGINGWGTGALLQTWSHVAYVRSGTTVNIFINGILDTTITTTTDPITTAPINYLIFGADSKTSNLRPSFQGYMDQIRMTVGVARYTTNFTVPSGPFLVKESPGGFGGGGSSVSLGTNYVGGGGGGYSGGGCGGYPSYGGGGLGGTLANPGLNNIAYSATAPATSDGYLKITLISIG